MNDVRQSAQRLIHFSGILKDCSHISIERDDTRSFFALGRVLVGPSAAEIVFRENVVNPGLWCLAEFTMVPLHSLYAHAVSPGGRPETQRHIVLSHSLAALTMLPAPLQSVDNGESRSSGGMAIRPYAPLGRTQVV